MSYTNVFIFQSYSSTIQQFILYKVIYTKNITLYVDRVIECYMEYVVFCNGT